ncbi:class I SAM-dependent methyltransferase [Pseudohoeflea coraliihabitans]|uniref:Class I SAM-dependent methyltransferase n=1 Tax=Pseudohoeflea coraliihabitans TaxID=2860393 RepID=A0ABS6WP63_9HYPH|nr:methyltransferase domain-containing protein [Pseudohoeflea sp. DP4N28-3]MBW3096885.1 class I SAM-dependent methyltransferase [Pseudohoeflea sp. DP4N28-3]
MKRIFGLLRRREIEQLDVDSDRRFYIHKKILASKPMLQGVFADFHRLFHALDRQYFTGEGSRIELGAGVAPMRERYADVIASDIVPSPGIDQVIDAQSTCLPDKSVRVFFGQNCFHHFPNPDRFFAEVLRVVSPGGGVVLLEPYYGPFASFLYPRLFPTEGFDKHFPSWETPVVGPMNGANQALSYIVFERDREEFERKYPELEIVHRQVCGNYIKYLLSGGLNFRTLWPKFGIPLLTGVEYVLRPFGKYLSIHHIIVIKVKE